MSEWKGFARRDFRIDGRDAILVSPQAPRKGRPWIWRTEFFGAFDWADLALLEAGFHLAYIDVQNLYGAPVALDAMDVFYAHLRDEEELSPRPVLEGFSRGGLFALNWALRHPHRVGCLYLDAPVCDLKSWPAGMGRAARSEQDWARLLAAYGLTEAQALAYANGPLDRLDELAEARIPILAIYGDADEALPPEENVELLAPRYQALGGRIEVIRKPGVGHHPHSLEDPEPILRFILAQDRA